MGREITAQRSWLRLCLVTVQEKRVYEAEVGTRLLEASETTGKRFIRSINKVRSFTRHRTFTFLILAL